MSTSDTIFVLAGQPLAQVVERLSRQLGLTRTVDEKQRVFLVRDLPENAGREVGGRIEKNPHLPVPDPDPDEISVIDGYDIAWDVWTLAPDEETSHTATRALFNDVTSSFPDWPALLVENLDLLVAAYRPEVGVVDFPPGTTPDGADQGHWRPFAISPPPPP